MTEFRPECWRVLERTGVDQEFAALCRMSTEPITLAQPSTVPKSTLVGIREMIKSKHSLDDDQFDALSFQRVTKLQRLASQKIIDTEKKKKPFTHKHYTSCIQSFNYRNHIIITSQHHPQRFGSTTFNSYVCVGRDIVGEVSDIVWIKELGEAVLILEEYRKEKICTVPEDDTSAIRFPVNQFPAVKTGEHLAFCVDEDLLVRKALTATREYSFSPISHFFIMIKPNSWFRF